MKQMIEVQDNQFIAALLRINRQSNFECLSNFTPSNFSERPAQFCGEILPKAPGQIRIA